MNFTNTSESNGTDDYYPDNFDPCALIPHDYLAAKLFLISICGSLVGLFGVFGNVTTALILTRPNMRTPNNFFLSTLAIFDTLLLVSAFLIYGLEYIIQYTFALKLYNMWLSYLRVVYGLSHISQTGSVYTTVAVTLERYFAVIVPNFGERLCTKLGAGVSIFLVTCFAVFFNCTKFFEFSVQRNEYCAEGTFQAYIPVPTKLGRDETYAEVYSLWTTNVVMVFFPFLILSVFNSIITAQIRRSAQETLREVDHSPARQKVKSKSKEATVVLIVMVTIFLVCNLWGFVLALMERIVGDTKLADYNPRFYAFSREAINFLAIVNSSINFIIYCIFSKEFRKELITVYCCGGGFSLPMLAADDRFRNFRRRSNNNTSKERPYSPSDGYNMHQWSGADEMDEDGAAETCLIKHSSPNIGNDSKNLWIDNESCEEFEIVQV